MWFYRIFLVIAVCIVLFWAKTKNEVACFSFPKDNNKIYRCKNTKGIFWKTK